MEVDNGQIQFLVCFTDRVFGLGSSRHGRAGQVTGDQKPATPTVGQPDWEMPVTAGVWYPQDSPLPEKPMRYYRVRCWPGCHSGSSLGMYPDKPLSGDTPLYSTSTVDNLPAGHPTLMKSHDPAN